MHVQVIHICVILTRISRAFSSDVGGSVKTCKWILHEMSMLQLVSLNVPKLSGNTLEIEGSYLLI